MKLTLTFFSVFIFFSCMAQTEGPALLYGYVQSVSPGAPPQNWDEGNENASVKAGKNYFIFLATDARAYPSMMWVEGAAYTPRVTIVRSTPVERKNANLTNADPSVLVPGTNKQVIQLIPAPAIDGKNSKKAVLLSKNHELVVLYKLNGKFYYNTLTKLTVLTGESRQ